MSPPYPKYPLSHPLKVKPWKGLTPAIMRISHNSKCYNTVLDQKFLPAKCGSCCELRCAVNWKNMRSRLSCTWKMGYPRMRSSYSRLVIKLEYFKREDLILRREEWQPLSIFGSWFGRHGYVHVWMVRWSNVWLLQRQLSFLQSIDSFVFFWHNFLRVFVTEWMLFHSFSYFVSEIRFLSNSPKIITPMLVMSLRVEKGEEW